MLPSPAQYLLRFDDLCPTVSRDRWQRCIALIDEFRLQPILAVVPRNQDIELEASPPDPHFWDELRRLEAAGATIAMHGYRHLCVQHGRSLVPLYRRSEFAGIPEETQREWIADGLRILREQGLDPRMLAAPRHNFDHVTLRALRAEGIAMLSDGFARIPYTRDGFTWIPQQIWEPVDQLAGLWTICIHPGGLSDAQFARLHGFLRWHSSQFTSVDRVLAELQPRGLSLFERMYASWNLNCARAYQLRARLVVRALLVDDWFHPKTV